ncbi:UNVERIFIED_CONTAM: hypothetical protein FKN15_037765 [Acipenser sinensis]
MVHSFLGMVQPNPFPTELLTEAIKDASTIIQEDSLRMQPLSILSTAEEYKPLSILSTAQEYKPLSILSTAQEYKPLSILSTAQEYKPLSILSTAQEYKPLSILSMAQEYKPLRSFLTSACIPVLGNYSQSLHEIS